MNITITPEQEKVFATEASLRNKTLGPDEKPFTAESIALLLIAHSVEGYAATQAATMRALMAPVADRIVEAADGDPAKLQKAIAAGEAAAMDTLQ